MFPCLNDLVILQVLLLLFLLSMIAAEAFFLPSLDSVLRPPSLPRLRLRPRAQPGLRNHRQPRRQNSYGHKQYNQARPNYPVKAAPFVPRPTPAPRPQDPGAGVKLDYGGWTAIGFDDSLPGQSVRSAPSFTPQIVTLEAAIAAAPPAQSDDLVESTYQQTTLTPVQQTYEQPAPAPSYKPASPAYKPNTSSYQPAEASYQPAEASYQPAKATYQPAEVSYQPAAPPQYTAPSSLEAVPAVPYIQSTLQHSILEYNNPAVAPKYEAPQQYKAVPNTEAPAPAPKYIKPIPAPKYVKPSPVSKYIKPSPTPKYVKPSLPPKYQKPSSAPKYQSKSNDYAAKYQKAVISSAARNTYTPPVTKRPEVVVLPAYTPAPPVYSNSQESPTNQYPIVAIITADSDVPEEQKYVSFSIGGADNGGSPDSLPSPGEYQATRDNTRLAKDVSGVYVQPATEQQDELYYIYYQDPELDPSYGVKIQNTRSTQESEAPLQNSAPLQDLPIYDYDEAREPESFRRIERNQPSYRTARQQPDFRATSRYGTDFGDSSSSSASSRSSVSFTTSVGGRSSGFSYQL